MLFGARAPRASVAQKKRAPHDEAATERLRPYTRTGFLPVLRTRMFTNSTISENPMAKYT